MSGGLKLGIDTTVAQTDIHHPTDNTLLPRLVRRPADESGAPIRGFRNRAGRSTTPMASNASMRPHLPLSILPSSRGRAKAAASLPPAPSGCREAIADLLGDPEAR